MKRNIFDKILGRKEVTAIEIAGSHVPIEGHWVREIHRADGTVERKELNNVVTALGLNLLADRLVLDTGSKVGWIAIGSWASARTVADSAFGEVVGGRKAGAIVQQSREWAYVQATWGGAADGVTSDDLQMAALCNHQTSGSGVVVNIVSGLSTVLADSDFLNLTGRIRVGSHNLVDS